MGAVCCEMRKQEAQKDDPVNEQSGNNKIRKTKIIAKVAKRSFTDNQLFIANEILKQRNKNMMAHLRKSYANCKEALDSNNPNYKKIREDEKKRCISSALRISNKKTRAI